MRPEPEGDGDPTTSSFAPRLDARVVIDEDAGAAVVVVTGEVDPETAPWFDEAVRRAEDYRPLVVVDLSACTFMDSSGLEVLIRAQLRTDGDGRAFVVRSPHVVVAGVLHISGVDEILVIEPRASET